MKKPFDRRSFLKIAGASFGIGVAYYAFPTATLGGEAGEMFYFLGKQSGEKVTPFNFLIPRKREYPSTGISHSRSSASVSFTKTSAVSRRP